MATHDDDARRDEGADLEVCAAATPGPYECKKSCNAEHTLQVNASDQHRPGVYRGVAHFYAQGNPVWDRKHQNVLGYSKESETEANAKLFMLAKDALPHWIRRAVDAEAALAALRGAEPLPAAEPEGKT